MTRSHTEEPDASCAGVLWGAAGGRGRPQAPSDPLRVRHCLAAAAAAFFALSAATICLYRLTHSARVLPGTASSIRSHRSSTEAGNLAKACSSARCCSALHSALAGGGGGSALPPPCAGAASLCAPALAGAGFGGAALGGAAGAAAAAARCWRCSRCRAARFSSSCIGRLRDGSEKVRGKMLPCARSRALLAQIARLRNHLVGGAAVRLL